MPARDAPPSSHAPLRMTAAEVEALDEAWKRLGFKRRTAMIKKAIEAILA